MTVWFAVAVTFCALFVAASKQPRGGDYGTGHLIGCGFFMIAAIVSLLAWLIWALVA